MRRCLARASERIEIFRDATPASADLADRLNVAFDVDMHPNHAYLCLSYGLAAFDDISCEVYAASLPTAEMETVMGVTLECLEIAKDHVKNLDPDEEILDGLALAKLCTLGEMDFVVTDPRFNFLEAAADHLFGFIMHQRVSAMLFNHIFWYGRARYKPQLCGLLVETHRHVANHPCVDLGYALYSACILASDVSGWNAWHYVLVALLRSGANPYMAPTLRHEAPIVKLCEGDHPREGLMCVKIFWQVQPLSRQTAIYATPPYKAELGEILNTLDRDLTPLMKALESMTPWQVMLSSVPIRLTLLTLELGLVDPLRDWYVTLHMEKRQRDKDLALLYRGALQPINVSPVLWHTQDKRRWRTFLLAQRRLRDTQRPHVNQDASQTVALFFRRSILV
jgi:hypothetical protein